MRGEPMSNNQSTRTCCLNLYVPDQWPYGNHMQTGHAKVTRHILKDLQNYPGKRVCSYGIYQGCNAGATMEQPRGVETPIEKLCPSSPANGLVHSVRLHSSECNSPGVLQPCDTGTRIGTHFLRVFLKARTCVCSSITLKISAEFIRLISW